MAIAIKRIVTYAYFLFKCADFCELLIRLIFYYLVKGSYRYLFFSKKIQIHSLLKLNLEGFCYSLQQTESKLAY